MTRRPFTTLLGFLTILAIATPAAAQTGPYIYFGAGPSMPIGDYGEYADLGWLVNVGFGKDLGAKGHFAGIDLMYGSNKHGDFDGDKTNLLIGLVNLGHTFNREAKVSPYVIGSVGMQSHQYKSESTPSAEASESMLVFGAGGGLVFKRNEKTSFWAEVRYLTGSKDGYSTNYVPVLFGMSINLR